MKAVKVEELFGNVPDWEYNGELYVFTYNNELYMPFEVAYDIGYIIRDEWIEEVTYETI